MPASRVMFSCDGCDTKFRIKRKNRLDNVIDLCNKCYITYCGPVPRPNRFCCFACKKEVRNKKIDYFLGHKVCKGCMPRCERCNQEKWDWVCGSCLRETGVEY